MAIHVERALRPLEHLWVSKRHLRAARRWPWAWWCDQCDLRDDGHGAAKTEPEATAAGAQHEAMRHNPEAGDR